MSDKLKNVENPIRSDFLNHESKLIDLLKNGGQWEHGEKSVYLFFNRIMGDLSRFGSEAYQVMEVYNETHFDKTGLYPSNRDFPMITINTEQSEHSDVYSKDSYYSELKSDLSKFYSDEESSLITKMIIFNHEIQHSKDSHIGLIDPRILYRGAKDQLVESPMVHKMAANLVEDKVELLSSYNENDADVGSLLLTAQTIIKDSKNKEEASKDISLISDILLKKRTTDAENNSNPYYIHNTSASIYVVKIFIDNNIDNGVIESMDLNALNAISKLIVDTTFKSATKISDIKIHNKNEITSNQTEALKLLSFVTSIDSIPEYEEFDRDIIGVLHNMHPSSFKEGSELREIALERSIFSTPIKESEKPDIVEQVSKRMEELSTPIIKKEEFTSPSENSGIEHILDDIRERIRLEENAIPSDKELEKTRIVEKGAKRTEELPTARSKKEEPISLSGIDSILDDIRKSTIPDNSELSTIQDLNTHKHGLNRKP